jgi:DNA polymerase III delta subunit
MEKAEIPRIMVVTGDDPFAIDLSRGKYLDRVRAAHGHFTLENFDAANERIGDFAARAMTASLFQEIRACCVLHAQALNDKELAILNAALDYEIPDVYIFISAETDGSKPADGKKKSSEKKVKDGLCLKERAKDPTVSVQEAAKPKDHLIAKWLAEQVSKFYDRQIGEPEARLLADTVEYDLIYSELQKIDMALPAGARIDRKIIQEITGATRTMTVYELAAALGKRDLPGALRALDSLLAANLHPTPAVAAVFKHFWAMLKIKKFLRKNPALLKQYNTRGYGPDSPQNAAACEIGIACGVITEKTKNRVYPAMILSGIVNHAQSFSDKGLVEIIRMLQEYDAGIKTGQADGSAAGLQMLCYRIARAGRVC